jgi:NADH-quinone oxidoreductase subunit G
VLRHFQGEVIAFADVVRAVGQGQLQAVYLAAGYPPRPDGWVTTEQAAALGRVPLLIVQDILPSPAGDAAHYLLPGATWAEKEGTFVNHAGLAQAIGWAASPPEEARTDGQIFLHLLARRGLVHAPSIRAELAAEVPFFAPLAQADLGEYGIRMTQ